MLQNNHNNPVTLPTARLVLGICAIILSLIFSIQFIAQGATGGMIIGAVIFAVIAEFAKVVFTGDFAYYFQTGQGSKALFSAIIIAILFALSISAAVFVLSISPAQEETLIIQSDNKVSLLQKDIEDKKIQLAKCNPSHLTKCVNLRTQELQTLQNEMNLLLKQTENSTLLAAKASAAFWEKAAEYLGSNPHSLQFNFAIARAVLLDLLGLIFISQYTASKRMNSAIEGHGVVIEEKPQQDNAAEVFALMSAKIEQLERQLSEVKKPESLGKNSAH